MRNYFLLIFFCCIPFSVFSSEFEKKSIMEFNNFVDNDGKDSNGEPEFMSIDLSCGNVKESIVMNGRMENPNPILVVHEPEVYSLKPIIHGKIYPASMDLDKMNNNHIGWQYHYNAPNGTIAIYLYNSGKAVTNVKISKGVNKGAYKSTCKVKKS